MYNRSIKIQEYTGLRNTKSIGIQEWIQLKNMDNKSIETQEYSRLRNMNNRNIETQENI